MSACKIKQPRLFLKNTIRKENDRGSAVIVLWVNALVPWPQKTPKNFERRAMSREVKFVYIKQSHTKSKYKCAMYHLAYSEYFKSLMKNCEG